MKNTRPPALDWSLGLALPGLFFAQGHVPAPAVAPGSAQPAFRRELPLAVEVTPILGSDDAGQPAVTLADLDAGNLVAGRTWWEFTPGVFFVETHLGFLWSPDEGMQVFTVPLEIFFNDLLTLPTDIASMDRSVVGTTIFKLTGQSLPFVWTPGAGHQFLETPPGWIGATVDVSADGQRVAGLLRPSLLGKSQAARWELGALDILGPSGQHSLVADGSADGSVLVGELGPDAASAQATSWVRGSEVGLAAVPGAASSSALHVSADGGAVIGFAQVGGQELLVRWEAGGVTTHLPPDGLLMESVNAINPTATAAVGALSTTHSWGQGSWTPFLWHLDDGFTLIDVGLPDDYVKSEAYDVSDDGKRVVGDLGAWVFGPGSEPPLAFLWTEESGTRDLEALQLEAGGPPLGIYSCSAISGDGKRMLATGIVSPSIQDTNSVILEFTGL